MSEIPVNPPQEEELERLVRYLEAALSDPVRISVLLAHGLSEDLIDAFLGDCVTNHELLALSKMRFGGASGQELVSSHR